MQKQRTKTMRGMNALIAVNVLIVFVAYVLAWIATYAPNWVEFVDANNNWYSIGLFNACKNGHCTYAWSVAAPHWTVTPDGTVARGWFYYDYTPELIVAAQVFSVIGVLANTFSGCCWVGGSDVAALSVCIPSVLYTIGYSCAASFFLSKEKNYSTLGLTSGYAAACAVACFVLSWLSVFVFVADVIVKKQSLRGTQEPTQMQEANTVDPVQPMTPVQAQMN